MTPLDKARDEAAEKHRAGINKLDGAIGTLVLGDVAYFKYKAGWNACLAHITASEEMKSVREALQEYRSKERFLIQYSFEHVPKHAIGALAALDKLFGKGE